MDWNILIIGLWFSTSIYIAQRQQIKGDRDLLKHSKMIVQNQKNIVEHQSMMTDLLNDLIKGKKS